MPRRTNQQTRTPKPPFTSLIADTTPTAPRDHHTNGSPAPEPAPSPASLQVPLGIALPQQTRRVREQILPPWYHYQAPRNPGSQDPAVADFIMVVNAALTAAEHAMITQDVGLMQLAFRTLAGFNNIPAVPSGDGLKNREDPDA